MTIKPEATYPSMPEWIDLAHVSDRTNALMRQNWALLNEAAALLNAGDMSPLAWAGLQDLWAETIDLEGEYDRQRVVEFDRGLL